MTRVGVVTFPGSLDDQDAARAVTVMGLEAVPLWHAAHDLEGVDAVILADIGLLDYARQRHPDYFTEE